MADDTKKRPKKQDPHWRTATDAVIRIDMEIGDENAKLLRSMALPGDSVPSALRRLCAHIHTQKTALDYYGRRQAILEKSLFDAMEAFTTLAREYGELSKGMRSVVSNTAKIEGRVNNSEARVSRLSEYIADKSKEMALSAAEVAQGAAEMTAMGNRQVEAYRKLEYLADYINGVSDTAIAAVDFFRKKP